MKNIPELNKTNVPVVRIDKSLNKYTNQVLFPEKVKLLLLHEQEIKTDTPLAKFRRRFPATDDLVVYLLATPPERRATATQVWEER